MSEMKHITIQKSETPVFRAKVIFNEYKRTCPYCKDLFIADHMNRLYCPEKMGIINYCKNRYKRALANLGSVEKEKDNSKVLPEAKNQIFISSPSEHKSNAKIESKENSVERFQLLKEYIGKEEYVLIDIDELKNKGFDFHEFDERYQMPGTEIYGTTHGPYFMCVKNKKEFFLTYKNKVKWLQQQ